MSMLSRLKSLFSPRARALALYRAGMIKANKRDYQGAVVDYSAAIQAPHIPLDVKGMAIYNRSLAYDALDEPEKAAADLSTVLEMNEVPDRVKNEASQRRERLRRRAEKAKAKDDSQG